MNKYWNFIDLPTPVILSIKIKNNHACEVVSQMKKIMNHIKNTMNDLSQLNIEAAALSRLLYKTKHKHRQDKSFKSMQKINRCLTNYISMHLPFTFSSIRDTLYLDSGPSKQMLEWALARLLGAAHLFHRVYSLCEEAAGHSLIKIKLEHFFEISLFSIATVSRIWTFSQFFVRQACEWYSALYQFLGKLEEAPVSWLPEGCVLPEDIACTLDNPQYLKLQSVFKPDKMISDLNIFLPENEKTKLIKNVSAVIDVDMFDDIGESVSRDLQKGTPVVITNHDNKYVTCLNGNQNTGRIHKKKKCQVAKNTSLHVIKSIRSSQDLANFYQTESALRNNTPISNVSQQPLMGKIDKLQWSVIEKVIRKNIKLIKKAEDSGSMKKQGKLLKAMRDNIESWIYF